MRLEFQQKKGGVVAYCPQCDCSRGLDENREIKTKYGRVFVETIRHDRSDRVMKPAFREKGEVSRVFHTCSACEFEIHFPKANTRTEFLDSMKSDMEWKNVVRPIGLILLVFAATTIGRLVWKNTNGWGTIFLYPTAVSLPTLAFLYSFRRLPARYKNILNAVAFASKKFLIGLFLVLGVSMMASLVQWLVPKGKEAHIANVISWLGLVGLIVFVVLRGVDHYRLLKLIDDELSAYFRSAKEEHQKRQESQWTGPEEESDDAYIERCLKLFGLGPSATHAEFKTAYKSFMRANHPDVIASIEGATERHIREATERCQVANSLKEVLEKYFSERQGEPRYA